MNSWSWLAHLRLQRCMFEPWNSAKSEAISLQLAQLNSYQLACTILFAAPCNGVCQTTMLVSDPISLGAFSKPVHKLCFLLTPWLWAVTTYLKCFVGSAWDIKSSYTVSYESSLCHQFVQIFQGLHLSDYKRNQPASNVNSIHRAWLVCCQLSKSSL